MLLDEPDDFPLPWPGRTPPPLGDFSWGGFFKNIGASAAAGAAQAGVQRLTSANRRRRI
jgi:hypothetical protein